MVRMISRPIRISLLVVLLVGLDCAAESVSSGGSFTLRGQPVGGGGASAGGAFQVIGEVGGAAPGLLSGGTFTLKVPPTGFFSIPVGDFELDILYSGSQVRLTWPPEASVYILESSTLLGPNASWEPVSSASGQSTFTLQADQVTRFFRLRSP
jgi:hypothetical protein